MRTKPSEVENPKREKGRSSHTSIWEAFFVAVDSIWSHKLRSGLTLLGMIIGVASVVSVGGAIEGFGAYMSGTLSSVFGNNTFLLGQILSADSYDEYEIKIKRNKPIYLDDLRAVAARCDACVGGGGDAPPGLVCRRAHGRPTRPRRGHGVSAVAARPRARPHTRPCARQLSRRDAAVLPAHPVV